jgi:DNA-binding transcriptional ArsR family regulator
MVVPKTNASAGNRQREYIFFDRYIIVCLDIASMPTTTFEVLAEPARRRLLDLLIAGSRPVGELVHETGLSQPNTSRHLRILREAGLVESRADGQRRLYALRREGFAEIECWLAPYVQLWRDHLGDLERHLDRME